MKLLAVTAQNSGRLPGPKYGRNTKSRNLASTFETPAFGPMVCRPACLQSLLWFAKFRIYYGRFLALGAKMSVSHYARQHALKWGRVAVKFQRKTSKQALKKKSGGPITGLRKCKNDDGATPYSPMTISSVSRFQNEARKMKFLTIVGFVLQNDANSFSPLWICWLVLL